MLGRQKRKGGYCAKWLVNKLTDKDNTVNEMVVKYKDLKIRPKWDDVKLEVMKTAVRAKFTQYTRLNVMLLRTGDEEFAARWLLGYHLGKILMDLRAELSA